MVLGAFYHHMLDQDSSNNVASSENQNIHVGEDQYSISANVKSNQISNISGIVSNNGMSAKCKIEIEKLNITTSPLASSIKSSSEKNRNKENITKRTAELPNLLLCNI